MQRRKFLKSTLAIVVLQMINTSLLRARNVKKVFNRIRPGDAAWPSLEQWQGLSEAMDGELIKLKSPLSVCDISTQSKACIDILKELNNPYYLGDEPALTQTSGWLNAWRSVPSFYAVAAQTTNDVVAAVNFARKHQLRLVIKGGGHSYQGTSSAPDSMLIWTKHMNKIELHDHFVASGCEEKESPQPAATIGAGAIWMQVYDRVTVKAGKYIQGGGCATVGVGGLIQSGGFGSFSKKYGLAAAALLEAEVVTADGQVLLVNSCNHPELFWALKGGGGGSFGVVTRLTLRTRALPEFFGAVFGKISASSDRAFKRLIAKIIEFYHDHLFNPHWGEQIHFSEKRVGINMLFQGLNKEAAFDKWKPLQDWVNKSPEDFTWQEPLTIAVVAARNFWDADFLTRYAPDLIARDDRTGAPEENVLWVGDKEQAGWFLYGYQSSWLSADLLAVDKQQQLVDALYDASRYWSVDLHFNKGLAGAPEEELMAARNTAINSSALSSFALAIIAGGSEPAFQGMPGNSVNTENGHENVGKMDMAMAALRSIASKSGSYVSESNYFEKDWQQSFWGSNYARLAAVKEKYDPEGLFFVRHGVGSEQWSDDGFRRL